MLKKLEKYMEKWLLKADTEDKEFLPPAVEILEKPPSPAGRVLIWVVIGLFILAVLWAFIGEIDEVVVARGKIIPIGYTKVLQSEDKGIVKRILVQEGQKVKEGDLLMELGRTMSESDLNALKACLNEVHPEEWLSLIFLDGKQLKDELVPLLEVSSPECRTAFSAAMEKALKRLVDFKDLLESLKMCCDEA